VGGLHEGVGDGVELGGESVEGVGGGTGGGGGRLGRPVRVVEGKGARPVDGGLEANAEVKGGVVEGLSSGGSGARRGVSACANGGEREVSSTSYLQRMDKPMDCTCGLGNRHQKSSMVHIVTRGAGVNG
jgi:hypothetical protein